MSDILERKTPEADLSRSYNLHMQAGLIITLFVMILLFKVQFRQDSDFNFAEVEQETVTMEEVVQTKQVEKPPPPPRPPVPVEVPNDEVIEDEILDLDAELDLDAAIDLPPPPPEEEEEPEVFIVVEKQPELVGGLAKLQRSIRYPEIARKAGIEGRVFVQFVVDERGRVLNPKVIRGIGGGCDQAAVEAVKQAKFKPGMQRGRPVKVQYSLPIVFKLQS